MACVCVTDGIGGDQSAVDGALYATEGHPSGVHDQRQGGQLGERTGLGRDAQAAADVVPLVESLLGLPDRGDEIRVFAGRVDGHVCLSGDGVTLHRDLAAGPYRPAPPQGYRQRKRRRCCGR